MRTLQRQLWFGILAVTLTLTSADAVEWRPQFGQPAAVGVVQKDSLDEISGAAVSRRNPGVLWVHNDKGGDSRIYALDWTGRLLGKYEMDGVSDRDYEDIAVGPGPVPGVSYLYVGNIGDNDEEYNSVWVYRFPEPAVSLSQDGDRYDVRDVDEIELVYPYGPCDAEALLVDTNGDICLVTKRTSPAHLYRAAYPQALDRPNTLQWTCGVYVDWRNDSDNRTVTGGDISANGGLIALRGYRVGYVWVRRPQESIAEALSRAPVELPLPAFEQQGEALAITPDAMGCLLLSEGVEQPIYYSPRMAVADVNSDGLADMADLAAFSQAWSRADCRACDGMDLDGDGAVGLPDVAVFAESWMQP